MSLQTILQFLYRYGRHNCRQWWLSWFWVVVWGRMMSSDFLGLFIWGRGDWRRGWGFFGWIFRRFYNRSCRCGQSKYDDRIWTGNISILQVPPISYDCGPASASCSHWGDPQLIFIKACVINKCMSYIIQKNKSNLLNKFKKISSSFRKDQKIYQLCYFWLFAVFISWSIDISIWDCHPFAREFSEHRWC